MPDPANQPPIPPKGEQTLALDWDRARTAQEDILAAAKHQGFAESSLFAVRLALEEAVANAYKHGNKEHPDKTVTIAWDITPHTITISIEDQGDGFDPNTLPDPTSPEYIERPHGRGVMLIRAYMTSVHYENHGRKLIMQYTKPA